MNHNLENVDTEAIVRPAFDLSSYERARGLISRLALASILWGAASLTASAVNAQEASNANRPNVLLIVADDLGYSDIGAFGGEIATPNLDALIASGQQLTNFYASPACSPTRAMLMSGTDNHLAGVGNMAELMLDEQRGKPGYEGVLNQRVVPFPQLLHDSGYNTYIAGKWHLGGKDDQIPANRGFDRSMVLLGGGASHFDGTGSSVHGPRAAYRFGATPFELPKSGFYSSDFYTDRVIEWIDADKNSNKPFFAYLAYTAPHWPLQAPEEFIAKYRGKYDDGYDAVRQARIDRMKKLGLLSENETVAAVDPSRPKWRDLTPDQRRRESRFMEIYAGMVDNLDYNVGRIVTHLKDTGQLDNTIIVFMSDNGPEGNDPEQTSSDNAKWIADNFDNSIDNLGKATSFVGYGPSWAAVSATPYRMFKGFTYEGGIRTPAFVSAPGRIPPGRNDALMTVMDVAPTVLDYAGVAAPGARYKGRDIEPIAGKSLVPVLAGDSETAHAPDYAMGRELMGRIGIRQGDWKLVWSNKPYGTNNWELFDLSTDRAEAQDLSSANPQKLKEMIGLWENYRKANGVIWDDTLADKTFYTNNDRHFAAD